MSLINNSIDESASATISFAIRLDIENTKHKSSDVFNYKL